MKFNSAGVEIAYEVEGPRTGIPVVFIHGFPFNRSMWKPQTAVLRNDFHLITYDVRGHGGSGTGDGQYTVELFVDDLIALLDHLKISRCVAAGLSMGGYIALRAIERNPERFRALVLCDTRSEADGNEGKIRRAAQAKAVKTDGSTKFAEAFVGAVFAKETLDGNPALVEAVKAMIRGTTPLSIAGTLIALACRTDTTASLFTVKVPTLILVGKSDTLTPVSASQAMKDKIPGSTMHIIPKAGHLSNMENPDDFNEHLASFLKSVK
jgi:3-oxoadipate enol-lactonase